MKPYYSVEELEELLDADHGCIEIADALKACGVVMIYNGNEADLSQWYVKRANRNDSGTIIAVRNFSMNPPSDEVIVDAERLPPAWKAAIKRAEGYDASSPSDVQDSGSTPQDSGLKTRERNNLLRVIRALDAMNTKPLPKSGYAESIRAKLDELGLTAISDDTIRKAIEGARNLDS